MGSDSDLSTLNPAIILLEKFSINFETQIISAHRTPQKMFEFANNAKKNNVKVIIAAAGGSAHLPGMIASLTTIPVIGIPVKSKTLSGIDSLLSIVQMPRGIPVATVAIDNGENAALLAIQILSITNEKLSMQIEKYRKDMQEEVLKKNKTLQENLNKQI